MVLKVHLVLALVSLVTFLPDAKCKPANPPREQAIKHEQHNKLSELVASVDGAHSDSLGGQVNTSPEQANEVVGRETNQAAQQVNKGKAPEEVNKVMGMAVKQTIAGEQTETGERVKGVGKRFDRAAGEVSSDEKLNGVDEQYGGEGQQQNETESDDKTALLMKGRWGKPGKGDKWRGGGRPSRPRKTPKPSMWRTTRRPSIPTRPKVTWPPLTHRKPIIDTTKGPRKPDQPKITHPRPVVGAKTEKPNRETGPKPGRGRIDQIKTRIGQPRLEKIRGLIREGSLILVGDGTAFQIAEAVLLASLAGGNIPKAFVYDEIKKAYIIKKKLLCGLMDGVGRRDPKACTNSQAPQAPQAPQGPQVPQVPQGPQDGGKPSNPDYDDGDKTNDSSQLDDYYDELEKEGGEEGGGGGKNKKRKRRPIESGRAGNGKPNTGQAVVRSAPVLSLALLQGAVLLFKYYY